MNNEKKVPGSLLETTRFSAKGSKIGPNALQNARTTQSNNHNDVDPQIGTQADFSQNPRETSVSVGRSGENDTVTNATVT